MGALCTHPTLSSLVTCQLYPGPLAHQLPIAVLGHAVCSWAWDRRLRASQGGQMQGAIRHPGGTAVSQGQSIQEMDTGGSPST